MARGYPKASAIEIAVERLGHLARNIKTFRAQCVRPSGRTQKTTVGIFAYKSFNEKPKATKTNPTQTE